MLRPGRYDKLVLVQKFTQTTNDTDGVFEDLIPPTWWCSIQQLDPSASDGTRTLSSRIEGRYRSDITVDTRLTLGSRNGDDSLTAGSREIFVKGTQLIGRDTLVCYCEETVA